MQGRATMITKEIYERKITIQRVITKKAKNLCANKNLILLMLIHILGSPILFSDNLTKLTRFWSIHQQNKPPFPINLISLPPPKKKTTTTTK